MDFKEERLEIASHVTHAADGTKLEPEEKPARRVLDGAEAPMSLGGKPIQIAGGRAVLPASVAYEGTVGKFAQSFRHQCKFCVHFDREGWQRVKRGIMQSDDIEQQRALNSMRAMLIESQDDAVQSLHTNPMDGDVDVEAALNMLGMCRAQSEIWTSFKKEFFPIITHPYGGCPTDSDGHPAKGPDGSSLDLYKPKNPAAEKAAAQGFDAIMAAALGERK